MKTKKLITAVLSIAMLSSVTVFAVSSASAVAPGSTVDIKVEDVTASAGETISIPVNVSIPDPGISGCEFAFTYDTSVITINSIEEGNISGGTGAADAELQINGDLESTMISGNSYSCLDYSINDGEVRVMWATGLDDKAYWLVGEGQFITINATVKEGASGTTEIDIVPINRDGNSDVQFGYVDYSTKTESNYAVNTYAGTVTIGGEAVETTTVKNENPSGDVLLGDVNCDGIIDIRDVTMLKQHVVQLITLEGQEALNANVIADDEINIKDLGQLLKYIVNLIDKF